MNIILIILDINYRLIKFNIVWNTIVEIEFSKNKIYMIEKKITEKIKIHMMFGIS